MTETATLVPSELPSAEQSPGEKERADSPSLSMGHNCAEQRGAELLEESNGQRPLGFKLTGSQKKTCYALRQNCQTMIEAAGLESIVFVTFTLGERDQWGKWLKVYEA